MNRISDIYVLFVMADKRRRCRKPGTLHTAKKKLWQAILTVEDLLLRDQRRSESIDDTRLIRAAHEMGFLIERYSKLVEVTDLQEKIESIERRLDEKQNYKIRKAS